MASRSSRCRLALAVPRGTPRLGSASQSPCGCFVKCWMPGWELRGCGRRFLAALESPPQWQTLARECGLRAGGQGRRSRRAGVCSTSPPPSSPGAHVCTLVFFPPSVFHFHGDNVFDTLVSRAAGPSHTRHSGSQRTVEPDRRHTWPQCWVGQPSPLGFVMS